jgi:hypothetical protein
VTAPALSLKVIDEFLALVPAHHCPALDELAATCVRNLDRFRRPAGVDEVQRRSTASLSKRQDAYLLRWGYPYVMEEFRFHITLTRRLSDQERNHTAALDREHFSDILDHPLVIDHLTLFREPGPGRDFIAVERYPLRASADRKAS